MDKKDFQIILDNLNGRVAGCKSYLDNINTTADFDRLTLAQARELRDFCINEQKQMNQVVMIELYHLIGMGKLTATQIMKLCTTIKQYLEYRTRIKIIASYFTSLDDLPGLPAETSYKLRVLADITLSTGEGSNLEFEDTVTAMDLVKLKAVGIPYTLTGKEVTVERAKAAEFVSFMARAGAPNGDVAQLLSKCESAATYLGIKWEATKGDVLHGQVTSGKVYSKMKAFFDANS